MRTTLLTLAAIFWLAGCADPSGITDPVVENPKPIELTIEASHMSEAQADDRSLGKGDDQEMTLVPASTPNAMWSNALDRSTIVVDTATGRILRVRLSLVPRIERGRDTSQLLMRRLVLEIDSSADVRLDGDERMLVHGQAFIVLRAMGMGGIVVYRIVRITADSADIPRELQDSIYCKLRLWRTSKRTIVFKLSLQHFVLVERQGDRDLRRLRASVLGEVPLVR